MTDSLPALTPVQYNLLLRNGYRTSSLEGYDQCRFCTSCITILAVARKLEREDQERERRISEFAAGGAENTALKSDDGKLRYDLLSPEFEEQMALALTHGAKKYDDRNYLKGEGLELKRPLAALRRHLASLLKGQDVDEDSKAHHAACVAVNAMFLYDLMTKKGKKF